ncbi:hypothetical protein ACFV7Q_33365 [Streptomyces sp. NPDC059851]|uniref:hypothetical protein n=1 Tax=Streptomyces sp. NPDC059851 TaxID=3346971 RepID=UPI0036544843
MTALAETTGVLPDAPQLLRGDDENRVLLGLLPALLPVLGAVLLLLSAVLSTLVAFVTGLLGGSGEGTGPGSFWGPGIGPLLSTACGFVVLGAAAVAVDAWRTGAAPGPGRGFRPFGARRALNGNRGRRNGRPTSRGWCA